MAVIIPTNAVEIARFANGLFGLQLGFATSNQVAGDVSAYGGLNAAFNNYYTLAYGSSTTASVAAAMAANLGITAANGVADADITSATAYITAQLNAAPASARGAVVKSVLDMWSNIASDPVNGPKYGTAATAWNNQIASAVTYAGAINPDITVAAAATAGSTFALTTGVDNFTGTTGNDTINAILGTGATLNSFDVVAAGAGTDTLNIVSDVAVAQTFPASITYSGLENVNLSRNGAGTNTLTVTNTTFGTGVQNFSVVDAGNTGAGAYSVTLASAKSVSVVSSATALGAVTITDTDSTTTATQGSSLNTATVTKAASAAINGNGVTTVNINAVAGLTTITSASGTRSLAVNASGTTDQGGLTDATATSVTLNVTGAQNFGTLTAAKATAVTINTNAASTTAIVAATATTLNLGGSNLNTLTAGNGNAALKSVVITGAGGVSSDLSGIATLTSVDTTGSTAAAPASGVLTGANTLTLSTGAAFLGGAGQDVITVGATTKSIALGDGNDTAVVSVTALGTGGSIDGGAGTNTLKLANADAVTLSSAGAVQTAFKAAVTNFSTLDITTQTASTISLTGAGTFNSVKFVSAAAAQVFSGATTGLTIVDTYGAAGTSVTTNNLSGASDVMNVTLKGDLSGAARVFGTFALPGVETVNITTQDTNATVTAQQATATLTDANATTINVSGNNGLALTHTGTALITFNASGVTKGGVSLTSGILTTDSVVTGSTSGGDTLDFSASIAKVTIVETAGTNSITGSATIASILTGGSGNDTIVGGSGKDVIVAGAGSTANSITGAAGADSIDLTGSAGVDTVKYGIASTSVSSTGSNVDTITNFTSGVDKIQLTAGDNSGSATTVTAGGLAGINLAAGSTLATMNAVITDATSVATIADVYTALATDLNNVGAAGAFAASATGAAGIVAREVTFTTGAAAGTYLVINDVTAAFQAATDMVIKLAGTTTFAATDLTVV